MPYMPSSPEPQAQVQELPAYLPMMPETPTPKHHDRSVCASVGQEFFYSFVQNIIQHIRLISLAPVQFYLVPDKGQLLAVHQLIS